VRYDQHHRLHTTHPALLPDRIAEQHERLTGRGKTVAITTATTSTARAINLEIQRRRRRHRDRSDRHVVLLDGTTAHPGDTIATRRNAATLFTDRGIAVRNRHTWTVQHVNRDGSTLVTNPGRGTVILPADYTAKHVELGWAVTGYGNQGITTDAGITVLEPGTSRAGLYVAMSRGSERNTVWIPDPTGTLDPEQALADTIARPSRALTAHAVREQLTRNHEEPAIAAPLPHRERSAELSR
jgi:ATP-dependent exoDNAse (exonuclease V) alpha subunit